MKILSKLLSIVFICHLLMAGGLVFAGSASFSLSAPNKPVEVGKTFVVNASINPAGAAIDTARIVVSFSSDIVSAVNVNLAGVLDSPSPGNTINNTAGTLSWGGFTVDRQLTSGGIFARITFRANATGEANIQIASTSKLISNGEEVGNPASFNQISVSTIPASSDSSSALQLTSSTHPNQDTWYQATTAQFVWNQVAGANYLWGWNHDPEGTPDQSTKDTSKSIRNIKSGIWYFHLQVKQPDGKLAEPVHYRVQVDNVKPNPIEPYLDVNDQQQLTVRFATTDYHSGISSYDLRVNQEDIENAPNPYILRGLNIGENFIVVTAYDLAGNVRQGWVKFVLNSDGTIRDITVSQEACSLPFGCDARGYSILFGIPALAIIGYLFYLRRTPRTVVVQSTNGVVAQAEQPTTQLNPDGSFTRTRTHTHTHSYTDTDTYTDTSPNPSSTSPELGSESKSAKRVEKRAKKGSNKRHR